MMKHRATEYLILVVYLAASTVSGSFHTHERGSDRSADGCAVSHCGHVHLPEQTEEEGESDDLTPVHACPVCRFLAQPPIAASYVEVAGSVPLAEVWTMPGVISPSKAFPSAHQSRAPPSCT